MSSSGKDLLPRTLLNEVQLLSKQCSFKFEYIYSDGILNFYYAKYVIRMNKHDHFNGLVSTRQNCITGQVIDVRSEYSAAVIQCHKI